MVDWNGDRRNLGVKRRGEREGLRIRRRDRRSSVVLSGQFCGIERWCARVRYKCKIH